MIYQYIVRDQKNGGGPYQLRCHQNKTDPKAMAINTAIMGSLIELRLMNALKKQITDHE
tara:strand:+ start:218 stop:394 length:177 start_codon:yes stop_codon:yes gene_type:complete